MSFWLRRTAWLAMAFVGITVLTGLGALVQLDQAGAVLCQGIASSALDVLASLLTLVGDMEITGLIALALAVRGWRREGWPGLVPLLLFVGVALEIVLKYSFPQPGPGFSRHLWHLPIAHPVILQHVLLYSFPSGHLLRTTFLAALLSERRTGYRPLAWVLVMAMAVTRVYLHEHWVSDVVGGWLLGWVLVSLAFTLQAAGQPQAGDPTGEPHFQ